MASAEKLPKPRPEVKNKTSLGSTMRNKLGVGRPLFPRRSTSRKGSSASYNSHDTSIGSPSPSSPGTVNRRDLLLVQTVASTNDGSITESQHTVKRNSQDRADDTPMQHNPYFNLLTPRASSPPIQDAQAMQHLYLQNNLMRLFLRPACLALTQLAPQSILAQSQPQSIIGPGYTHNVPSTTSLATYLSTSEYAATSASSHQPTNISSLPFSHNTARSGASISMVNGEQLAASALPMPTTSISALWRILCTLDWIQEHSKVLDVALGQRSRQTRPGLNTNPSSAEEIPQSPDGTFEIGAMLQGVADVLGSYAAHLGVELVLYHGEHPASESKRALQMENGIQELHCKGDEIGLGLAITAILSHIMAQTKPLATIEVGLQLTPPRDPLTRRRTNLSATSSHSEADSVTPVRNWFMALTITQTFSPAYPSSAIGAVDTLAREPVLAALLQTFDLALSSGIAENSTRCTWSVTTRLTEATFPTSSESMSPPPPTPLSLPSRARSRTSEVAKDPALPELFKFADSLLKRKKAVLHSTESSVFAKHLTGYLTSWGMDISHVAFVPDEASEQEGDSGRSELSKSKSRNAEARNSIGRFDSGFGGSDSQSPPSNTPEASNRPPSIAEGKVSAQLDASVSFIIIDDDISVLRRQLAIVKASQPGLHLNNTILHKRPGLGRRTRSTAQIRTIQPSSMVAIIHFTSSSNYRFIREIVQSIFKTASGNSFLPEVLVLPKPIGPRRLLTTMHTAVKRPVLDPSFTPIATSPSSAEGQFYFGSHSGRPSPAASLQQDFDSAFAEARTEQQQNLPSSLLASLNPGPATPPITIQPSSNPSSPRATSAEAREYIEYMSKTTPDFSNTASAGILLQSPDGKPSGLFFQPVKRGPSTMLARESRAGSTSSSRMVRDRLATADLSAKPSEEDLRSQKVDIPAPAETNGDDLHDGSPVSLDGDEAPLASTSSSIPLSPGSQDHDAPILSPPAEVARALPLNELAMKSDDIATSSGPKHPGFSRMPTASAALSSLSTIASPLAQSPPRILTSAPLSAPVEHQTIATAAPQLTPLSGDESRSPMSAPPAVQKRDRRSTSRSDMSKKTPKLRKPPVIAVPPINVLIVEDNPINQTILSTFMKRKGIRYAVAKDGQEAVDKWKAGAFHLVLMDIQLPVKDGITATMEIRAMEHANNIQGQITPTTEARAFDLPPSQRASPVTSPSQLPVIIVALTASSLQSDRLAALAAGCNDFITKPVSLQWLQQKLLEWGSMSILSSFKRLRQSSSSSQTSLGSSFLDRSSAQAKALKVASRLHIDSKMGHDRSTPSAAITPPIGTSCPSVIDTPKTVDSLDEFRTSDDSLIQSATRDPKLAAEYDQTLLSAAVSSETRPGPSPIEVNTSNQPESAESPQPV